MEFLNALSQYTDLINFALLITIIGWLFALTRLYKEAMKEKYEAKVSSLLDRLELCNERLNTQEKISNQQLEATKADLERTSTWYERDISDLRKKLSDLIVNEGVTKEQLLMSVDTTSLTAEIKAAVEGVLRQITTIENKIETEDSPRIEDPNFYLELAQGYFSSNQWLKAAEYYDKYITFFPTDWEIHFLRGTAYVNSRKGEETNIDALRAYNESIAFMPFNVDNNLKARLFAYRGAVAKRLRRLDEAEADLLLAQKYATADYEVYDIKYNLAAVYAMQGKRSKTFKMVKELLGRSEMGNVRIHLDDYFSKYSDDTEFLELIR